ncbi:MAG: bifunctional demethylmenaquinone methyltransferase/2-methoxy-6-polyprenyl-1,4-benzoquinol methylase UbiE [Bdellovibrionota bacterium]
MSNKSPADLPLNSPDPSRIQAMFAQVAPKYDSANTVLSLGLHHMWRSKLVKLSDVKKGDSVLDCATGTGDLAIEFKKAVGPEGKVIGTDFCAEMLESAPRKAASKNLDIKFELADVTKLQFDDATFDAVSISFGIRNVQDRVKGISEMARVAKPGGRVMILEFGQMSVPVIKQAYNFYSEKVLPVIGGIVTGKPDAYEYLQKSSAAFPCGAEFINMMDSTEKFSKLEFVPVFGGIAYIYKGVVKG